MSSHRSRARREQVVAVGARSGPEHPRRQRRDVRVSPGNSLIGQAGDQGLPCFQAVSDSGPEMLGRLADLGAGRQQLQDPPERRVYLLRIRRLDRGRDESVEPARIIRQAAGQGLDQPAAAGNGVGDDDAGVRAAVVDDIDQGIGVHVEVQADLLGCCLPGGGQGLQEPGPKPRQPGRIWFLAEDRDVSLQNLDHGRVPQRIQDRVTQRGLIDSLCVVASRTPSTTFSASDCHCCGASPSRLSIPAPRSTASAATDSAPR